MRFLFFAWCFLAAIPVYAQTVVVRSGDHPQFTRLTFALPPDVSWTLTEGEGEVTVSISGGSATFDIGTFFDRISRDRVTEVVPSESSLNIRLGCECDVESFETDSGLLVLDIQSETESDGTAYAVALDRWKPVPDTAYQFAPTQLQAVRPETQAAKVVPPPISAQSGQQIGNSPRPRSDEQVLAPGRAFLPVIEQRVLQDARRRRAGVAAAEDQLLAQLDRAVNQGLLTPQNAQILPGPTKDTTGIEGQTLTDLRNVNLSASSAMSETERVLAAGIERVSGPLNCTPDAQIALSDWADGRPFHSQIAELRLQIYGEFDRLDTKAADRLAKVYLHFGFGTEAAQLFKLSGMDLQSDRVALSLASILEDEVFIDPNAFVGQASCPSDVALWAVLAMDEPNATEISDRTSVIRSFAKLPTSVQSHLGARLIDEFLTVRDVVTADAIRRILNRNAPEFANSIVLSTVALETETGDMRVAEGMRDEILRSNTVESPQALIDQVDHDWRTDADIQPSVLDLLDAYRFEHRDGDLGPALDRARVRVLTRLGDFQAALDLSRNTESETLDTDPFTEAMSVFSDVASDFDVIRQSIVMDGSDIERLAPETANRLAERLRMLGFADQALRLSVYRSEATIDETGTPVRAVATGMLGPIAPADVLAADRADAGSASARVGATPFGQTATPDPFDNKDSQEEGFAAKRQPYVNSPETTADRQAAEPENIELIGRLEPTTLAATRGVLTNSIQSREALVTLLVDHGVEPSAILEIPAD